MIWRGVLICLVLAACQNDARDGSGLREHPGVLGLGWGAKEKETRRALEDKFGVVKRSETVADAHVRLQAGNGTFEGIPIDTVQADLLCGELRRLELFPAKDQRSLFRRWKSLVATLTAKYGAPNTEVEPPSAATATVEPPRPGASPQLLRIDQDAQEAVSKDIQDGRGKLMATWDFADTRGVSVMAWPGDQEQNGRRDVILAWSMFDLGQEEHDCEEHHPELVRLRDF